MIEDAAIAEADASQAKYEEEQALEHFMSMKKEQREIQRRKERFHEMKNRVPRPSREYLIREREAMNAAIVDYNKRKDEAEKKYNDAKERAEELRKKADEAKRLLERERKREERDQTFPQHESSLSGSIGSDAPITTGIPPGMNLQSAMTELLRLRTEAKIQFEAYLDTQKKIDSLEGLIASLLGVTQK